MQIWRSIAQGKSQSESRLWLTSKSSSSDIRLHVQEISRNLSLCPFMQIHCKNPLHQVGGVIMYTLYAQDSPVNLGKVGRFPCFVKTGPSAITLRNGALDRLQQPIFSFPSPIFPPNFSFFYAPRPAAGAHWNRCSDSTTVVNFHRISEHSSRLNVTKYGRPTSPEKIPLLITQHCIKSVSREIQGLRSVGALREDLKENDARSECNCGSKHQKCNEDENNSCKTGPAHLKYFQCYKRRRQICGKRSTKACANGKGTIRED